MSVTITTGVSIDEHAGSQVHTESCAVTGSATPAPTMRFNDVIALTYLIHRQFVLTGWTVCLHGTTITPSTLNMPMRYRSDSPPVQPLYPEQIEPTDADDSIVLSDLVRTGEASRLRRRGAMRLDHNLLSAQRNEGGRVTPPTVVVARTPSWIEPPSDDDESTQAWEQGYDPSSPRPQGRTVVPGPETCGYTLYCGGEETSSSFVQQAPVYVRLPLPSYPPTSDSGLRRRDDPLRKTNGCGAVVHLRASRRDGSSVWVGKDEATSAVVPMDASYFERRTVVRMIRSACGCVREGVGCAIWWVHPSSFLSYIHTCPAATRWGPAINLARLLRRGYFPISIPRRCPYALRDQATGTAVLQPQARAPHPPTSTLSSLPTSPALRSHQLHEFHPHHPRERRVSTPSITHST